MNEIQKVGAPLDIGQVLNAAIEKGIPVSELKEAFDLVREMAKMQRESAFNAAFTKFKQECPPIIRRTEDANPKMRVTRNGVNRPRMYASLDDIASQVNPHLHNNGLTFDYGPTEIVGQMCVVRKFILRHVDGHFRETTSAPIPVEGTGAYREISKRDESSASPQQRMGIADTYAMRYALIAGLGLTTCDEDDDGHTPHRKQEEPTINEEQCNTLNDLLMQAAADKAKFLAVYAIERLSDLPASKYDQAVRQVQTKIAQNRRAVPQ